MQFFKHEIGSRLVLDIDSCPMARQKSGVRDKYLVLFRIGFEDKSNVLCVRMDYYYNAEHIEFEFFETAQK